MRAVVGDNAFFPAWPQLGEGSIWCGWWQQAGMGQDPPLAKQPLSLGLCREVREWEVKSQNLKVLKVKNQARAWFKFQLCSAGPWAN